MPAKLTSFHSKGTHIGSLSARQRNADSGVQMAFRWRPDSGIQMAFRLRPDSGIQMAFRWRPDSGPRWDAAELTLDFEVGIGVCLAISFGDDNPIPKGTVMF